MGIHKARRAKVRQLCSEAGVIRPSDTAEVGSSPAQLRAMHKRGELKRVGHGLYADASSQLSALAVELATLQRRSPGAFICGVTAAYLYELLPDRFASPVWLGLPAKARRPTGYEHYFISYFSGRRANKGIRLDPGMGFDLRMASPARAVCELFSRRKIVGEKIPRVALREYLGQGRPQGDLFEPAMLFGVSALVTRARLAPEVDLTPEEIRAYVDAFRARTQPFEMNTV